MQTLLRDPAAGIMHSLIYFSFLILLARHHGPRGRTTSSRSRSSSSTATCTGATPPSATPPASCCSAGVLWAIVRRYVQRPYRIRIKSKPEHALILGTFLSIGVTGFGAEVWRIALRAGPTSRSGRSSATRCRA